jgi:hypothetical protein
VEFPVVNGKYVEEMAPYGVASLLCEHAQVSKDLERHCRAHLSSEEWHSRSCGDCRTARLRTCYTHFVERGRLGVSARLSRMQCGGSCHRREISVLDSNRWLSGLRGGKPRSVASDDARCFGFAEQSPPEFQNAEANRLAVFRARAGIPIAPTHAKGYVNPRAVDAYDAGITISRAVNRADRLDDSVRRSRAPTTPEPFSSSWYVAKFAENRRMMVRPTRTCYFCLSAVTTPGGDAVFWLVVTALSCAMGAAIYRLVHLDAVPEYATAAVGALRSQGLDRAFETVECCGAISACHSEGSIVLIATGFTLSHEILLLFYCLAYLSWSASL